MQHEHPHAESRHGERQPAPIRKDKQRALEAGAARAEQLQVRALALGERIDLKELAGERLTADSTLLRLEEGTALVFRYGSVVFFGVPGAVQKAALAELVPLVSDRYPVAESEVAELSVGGSAREASDGELAIPNTSTDTLQIVADVFAKSVALAHYETAVAKAFDQIEPLAIALEERGRTDRRFARVVRQIARAARSATSRGSRGSDRKA